jgi:DNA mismatch repair protein MutS2
MTLLASNVSIPLGGLEDPRPLLQVVRIEGGVLEQAHWRVVRRVLELCAMIVRLREGWENRYLSLSTLVAPIERLADLEQTITRTFDDDGTIRDSATPALQAARQALRGAIQRQLRAVNRMTQELYDRGWLQEPIATVRNGRNVFLFKSSMRGRAGGIFHGVSGSGESSWVEPPEMVELSNEVEGCREAEQREVHRILRALTELLRSNLPFFEANVRVLERLDGLLGIARTANENGWHLPIVLRDGAVRLFNAHHPLLNLTSPRSVPITMRLDAGDRCLILSGPNAGGKTTAMKALGLLSLLVSLGLPIPAFPDSQIPLFTAVLADIGDQQSLAEGLSTFSGHLRRIREICDQADARTLVLLDELGTGTDPQEGGALALALLEFLHRLAALTVTTSHLNPIKQWAEDTAGVRNASFSLDPTTHEPTFTLRLDLPGASEALEIAAREGLPAPILARARELAGSKQLRMGELLRRIEEKERTLSIASREAEARAKSLGEQEALARSRAEAVRAERREMREETLRLRTQEMEKLRERFERFITELPGVDEAAKRKESLLRAREELLREVQVSSTERRRLAEETVQTGEFVVGQKIFVKTMRKWGDLTELADGKKKARVRVNSLEMVVKVDDLLDHDPAERRAEQEQRLQELEGRTEGGKPQKKSRRIKNALRTAESYSGPSAAPRVTVGGRTFSAMSRPSSMTLDLHGFRVEEALASLDKFIDQALLASYPYIKICHGTGTGRLYKAVHEYLRTHSSVRKFRFGTPEEGGGGMTVVEL